jgi:predicted helicase
LILNLCISLKKNEHWINSPRTDIMKHFINDKNVGLVVARQCADDWKYILCTKDANDFNLTGTAGRYGSGYTFPLYLYTQPSNNQQTAFETIERTPNLNPEIVKQIEDGLGLQFVHEPVETLQCNVSTTNTKTEPRTTFAPIDILDYIYAVLHSPTYREKYKEFLKIDFPRVPYPTDIQTFWKLVDLGGELREIHLLESPTVEKYITQYPEDGENIVTKPVYKNGNVYINETQYFANVPEVAWNFYIGGYQPAQKWLKDRKDRELSYEDILHYQKIIVALSETDRIMREIDGIEI